VKAEFLTTFGGPYMEVNNPSYRAHIWKQRKAPEGSNQEAVGWKLDAYQLSDVNDVTKALNWLEANAREAREDETVHAVECTLYAFIPSSGQNDWLVQLYGTNPTRNDGDR